MVKRKGKDKDRKKKKGKKRPVYNPYGLFQKRPRTKKVLKPRIQESKSFLEVGIL